MHPIEEEIRGFIRYWTYPLLRPRRFHAYCVGMPKTGTHSLSAVLQRYRSRHEPESTYYMRILMQRSAGELSPDRFRDKVRHMDRRLWVELNSSYINYFMLDVLLEEYPQAKFILTIRDAYSWLDSLINQLLGREHGDLEKQFHDWYAKSMSLPGTHGKGDRVLAERGIWPLDGCLQAWSRHNGEVLERVPENRLLVVRTHEILDDIPRIAQFLGVPPETLDSARSHEYKAAEKFHLLAELDRAYLEEQIDANCRPLMDRFFPEVRSLDDVRGYRPQDRHTPEKAAASS